MQQDGLHGLILERGIDIARDEFCRCAAGYLAEHVHSLADDAVNRDHGNAGTHGITLFRVLQRLAESGLNCRRSMVSPLVCAS